MVQFTFATKKSTEARANVSKIVADTFSVDNEEQPELEVNNRPPPSWFKIDCLVDHEDDSAVLQEDSDDNIKRKRSVSIENKDEKSTKRVKVQTHKTAGLVSVGRFVKEKDKKQALKNAEHGTREPKAKYIERLMQRSTHREIEHEIIKERLLQKEQQEITSKEVFVTGAYRKRLEERRRFEQELAEKDIKDSLNDSKKKKDLTSFHHYMLSKGLATRSCARDHLFSSSPQKFP